MGLNKLNSQYAEGSIICLILCNNVMGIIMHFILESGLLHQTTFSVTSLSEGQVDKQVNVKPCMFLSKV